MIIDKLKNKDLYCFQNPDIKKAFDHLLKTDTCNLKPGKHEIDGRRIFMLVNEYSTRENTLGILEAHKKYIDLQYMEKGSEIIEYEPLCDQKVFKEYNLKDDYSLYNSRNSTKLRIQEGMFAIFFPDDLHMPGIIDQSSVYVKKIVIKILSE